MVGHVLNHIWETIVLCWFIPPMPLKFLNEFFNSNIAGRSSKYTVFHIAKLFPMLIFITSNLMLKTYPWQLNR